MPLPTTEAELAAYLHEKQLRPVPGSAPRQTAMPADTPEAELLARIRRLACDHGFLVYHTWRSDHSEAGFPDLVLAKPGCGTRPGGGPQPGRLIFAEVKTRTGKLTMAQHRWLEMLRMTLPELEVYLWRPQDWPTIQALLTWEYANT